ncbi:guanylin-like [Polyodon spathula]|uniref:guanylin-like n=1 Tax=Polyodon spathula TaxID=7913 RepID=UPI001B7E3C4D|nr:guanylin-like [Polyodon spathula]
MRVLLATIVCFSTLSVLSEAVVVKDGDFTFSLEAVKKLKDLMDGVVLKRSRMSSSAVLCTNPALPEEFRAVCQSTDASMVFSRLRTVADHEDICEICAMAACTGCF